MARRGLFREAVLLGVVGGCGPKLLVDQDTGTTTADTEGDVAALRFSASPAEAWIGRVLDPPVEIEALDRDGERVESPTIVRLRLDDHPEAPILQGETEVASDEGVARFDTVWIDARTSGVRLVAETDEGLVAESPSFDVVGGWILVSDEPADRIVIDGSGVVYAGCLGFACAQSLPDPSMTWLRISTDAGRSWHNVLEAQPASYNQVSPSLAADPERPGTVYFADLSVSRRTDDHGASWTDLAYNSHWGIGAHDDRVVWVGFCGPGGWSTDAGASWRPPSGENGEMCPCALDAFVSRERVAIACFSAVWELDEREVVWKPRPAPGPAHAFAARDDGSCLLSAGYPGSADFALYRSEDCIDGWQVVLEGSVGAIAIDRTADIGYANLAGTLMQTQDAGRTWQPAADAPALWNTPLEYTDVPRPIAIDPTDSATVYLATPSGIHKTHSGGR